MNTNNERNPSYEIDPIFTDRWSPRAFTGEPIPDSDLFKGFEAARWAPSAFNSQPWKFIYSKKHSSTWKQFNEFLDEFNRAWAQNASALVILLGKKEFLWNGKLIESPSASFDLGAAWMSFALQMKKIGWATHGMAGFDKQLVHNTLEIPQNFSVELMVAVGKIGDKSTLPERLQSREVKSSRQPLDFIHSEGIFNPNWKNHD